MATVLGAVLLIGGTGCNGGDKKSSDEKNAAKTDSSATPKSDLGKPISYQSGKRYIFLTFDDGPQPPGTINCKNIFHEEGVKASFFLVGFNMEIDAYRRRMADSLNNSYPEFVVANHSTTHGFRDNYRLFYNSPDSAVADMLKAQKDLKVKLKVARLPGMNTWASAGQVQGPKSSLKVANALDSLGYTIIGWDLEWQFMKGSIPKQGAEEMAAQINKRFEQEYTYQPNTFVLLAHDRMFAKPQYADSLRKFISIMKQDPRNVFETIDHYPTVQNRK
ncbi:polysaccharide deacetylase family protein [Niabella sp.]|uniref:polysaccharide deacetylase family protein n=1 Tax=Niabella sp. TaxID=1962976 RepID=UPI002626B3FC|nr:polysaccharide deacetylase family protein [Niabella sp.]